MPRLLYLSLARMPTEKAHGLQIVQNCEAFANAGYDVRLWTTRRINTPEMRDVDDIHAYYGVDKTFSITRLPVLDAMPLANKRPSLERIAILLVILSYLLVLLVRLPFTRADIYYSRDEWVLYLLTWLKPHHKIAYEAHLYAPTQRGGWLQAQVVRRCGSTIAITPQLRADLIAQRGAPPERVLTAHDGIRSARFADLPSQSAARDSVGWPQTAFIVGFVGRLHMLNVDKGVGALVQALADVPGASLALVGGPDDQAYALREMWLTLGLPPERFLYAGHVLPADVPRYLCAMDVCAMPHPYTQQFAHYTSPLKLFEYMAAGRAIVASDLPGWADVIQHDHTALLIPPGDVAALAAALRRLHDDATLRDHLGTQARQRAMTHYTWDARARLILGHVQKLQFPDF